MTEKRNSCLTLTLILTIYFYCFCSLFFIVKLVKYEAKKTYKPTCLVLKFNSCLHDMTSINHYNDSRNVRHAEKFYAAGVFWQSTGPIIGIREPTPLTLP